MTKRFSHWRPKAKLNSANELTNYLLLLFTPRLAHTPPSPSLADEEWMTCFLWLHEHHLTWVIQHKLLHRSVHLRACLPFSAEVCSPHITDVKTDSEWLLSTHLSQCHTLESRAAFQFVPLLWLSPLFVSSGRFLHPCALRLKVILDINSLILKEGESTSRTEEEGEVL